MEYFFQILWLSQNIRTLPRNKEELFYTFLRSGYKGREVILTRSWSTTFKNETAYSKLFLTINATLAVIRKKWRRRSYHIQIQFYQFGHTFDFTEPCKIYQFGHTLDLDKPCEKLCAWSHCAVHKGHAEGHMMDPFPLPKRINNTKIVGKKS